MKKQIASRILLTLTTSTLIVVANVGCQNPITKAARDIQYSAYEMVGVQKRDLLKTRVDDARDEQKEAGENFQDALQRLQALTGYKGGELENRYDQLKSSYEKSKHQADAVRKSIKKVETVARDLFQEWENEIGEMSTASLKDKSRQTLVDTRKRYGDLIKSLKASESRMDPVLRKLNDQVLFIKHNLNAKALASLKGETLSIQKEIETLLKEMNESMASADQFIKNMP